LTFSLVEEIVKLNKEQLGGVRVSGWEVLATL